MKNIIFAILSAMLALTVVSCGDEDEAVETAAEDVAAAYCDRVQECDPDTYAMLDGMGGCDAVAGDSMLSEEACPAYDAVIATDCVNDANAMSCDEFTAMLASVMAGGSDGMPASCDEMCGE